MLRTAVHCFMAHHEPFELEEVFLNRIEPALDRDSLQWLLTEKFTRQGQCFKKVMRSEKFNKHLYAYKLVKKWLKAPHCEKPEQVLYSQL